MLAHRTPLSRSLIVLLLVLLAVAVSAGPVSAGFSSRGGGALLPAGSASLSVLVLKGYYDVGPAPLEGAIVELLNVDTGETVARALTNERGLADFKVEPGNYSLFIQGKGKATHFTKWITFEGDQSYNITVTLLPLE